MTPHFFYISEIINSSSYSGKSFRKKSMLKNFRANVLKQYLAVAIYLGLQTLALFANECPILSHFGCFSGHVLSKTKSVTPHFFYISDITNSSSYSGKSFRKKSMLKNFRANVLNLAPTGILKEMSFAYLTKRLLDGFTAFMYVIGRIYIRGRLRHLRRLV